MNDELDLRESIALSINPTAGGGGMSRIGSSFAFVSVDLTDPSIAEPILDIAAVTSRPKLERPEIGVVMESFSWLLFGKRLYLLV